MNARTLADIREKLGHRARLIARHFDPVRRVPVFSVGNEADTLRRIYVINLDRKPDRWQRVRRELNRFRERTGQGVSSIVRRFSAVDARYLGDEIDPSVLDPRFTLAEQLAVHPNPVLEIDDDTRAIEITMTRQERAVALSHVEIWRLIANGDVPSALVLEDDVILAPGFAAGLTTSWSALVGADGAYDFDVLYLAYRDVGTSKPLRSANPNRRISPGIWEASAYVLSQQGAKKLLARLPVRGPVDLWLNMQFGSLLAFTVPRPLIEQRIDEPSTNSYSVLPVLSQVGAITREKPLLPEARSLPGPVIAVGPPGTGLTALAKALSMLGYTCLSDLNIGPLDEMKRLLQGRRGRRFNAYVNVGNIGHDEIDMIFNRQPRALFITTGNDRRSLPEARSLHLPLSTPDKWADLCGFLKLDYPPFAYPEDDDTAQRKATIDLPEPLTAATDLKFDRSPWIVRTDPSWRGIAVESSDPDMPFVESAGWDHQAHIDQEVFRFREDTFPSNLALFNASNVVEHPGSPTLLVLQEDVSPVREFSSAAIASRESHLYGSFSAKLRPPRVPGLVTGIFLHRNGPRQEIDIEFTGSDTTRMLVNVYYNPGPVGTKLEFGYRGTPTSIDLGFDAADEPHLYEIVWLPHEITWKVDGRTVYRRHAWGPTPIPDRALELNVNLWHSRSTELAGRLDASQLPAAVHLHSIAIDTLQRLPSSPTPDTRH